MRAATRAIALTLIMGALPSMTPAAARDTPLEVARQVRAQGCHGRPGTHTALRYIGGLNEAALAMSHGASLQKAMAAAGYRDQQSAALHVSGDAAALDAAIGNQMCESLVDASFTDLGVAQRGLDTWMIIAVPFSPPSIANTDAVDAEVLQRINSARAQARRCGNKQFPATGPLQANPLLRAAAQSHARDMLQFNYFSHEGHDGSNPAQRVTATGYSYRIVGENIASGPETAAEAVAGWIASPDHCENLMDARFAESGVAFAATTYGPARIYWVQEFGTQRQP